MAQIDYGIDAPKDQQNMLWRGGTFLAFGVAVYMMNRGEYPGPALSMLLAFGLVGAAFLAVGFLWHWTSRNGKEQLRDRILDAVELRGDEKVLDVGCGRGLVAIGAAKRLAKGKVTAVDIWSDVDLSGNTKEGALANAKAEGVADRVKIETADAVSLPFNDASFDVVASSLCVHNLPAEEDRAKAIAEMFRVLKPGGRVAIYDLFRTSEYAAALRKLGASEVEEIPLRYGLMPGRLIKARRPSSAA